MQITSTSESKQNIQSAVKDDVDELSSLRGAEEIVELDDDTFPWIDGEEPTASDDLYAADFTDTWLEQATSKDPAWRRIERYNELRQLHRELDYVGSITENHSDMWH